MGSFAHFPGHLRFRDCLKDVDDDKVCCGLRNIALAVAGTVILVHVGRRLYASYQLGQARKEKQETCRNSKKIVRSKLANAQNDSEWEEIRQLSLAELIDKLQKKEISAVDAVLAYQALALEVDEELNCVCEPIVEAESWAKELDQGPIKGLLHGLPISIKDSYGIQGYDQTLGSSKNIGHPYAEDAVIIKVLKRQGAVPIVKTNSPQTMYSFECSNPIFGRTLNPHNNDVIPGGSSGGEAALLASGASVLGFGSDLGGSVRIPSNMCGTFALKPTIGRISKKGMHRMCRANQMIGSSLGPMARDTDGLVAAMRALLVPYMYELDPNLSPILFQEDLYQNKKPLRIGYYTYDGFIHAVPAQVRGVNIAKAALENLGHTLVPWCPPNADKAFTDLWWPIFLGDEGGDFMKEIENDSHDPCIAALYPVLRLKQKTRKFISRILRPFSPLRADLYTAGTDYSTIHDWWNACRKLESYREECATSWVENDLDAVICPGFSCPAMPPGMALLGQISYTSMYNTLNWPAGSLPVTKVTQKDLEELEKHYPTEPYYHKITKEGSRHSINLPINVQCAALPFKDEICLRVMKELETALKE